MIRSAAKFFGALSFLCILFSFAEAEEARDKVIIVLDASGSMWGQIEGEPKIAIAKSVVKELVEDWNADVDLGLTAYGHRRKADCNDIEMVVAPGPLKKAGFIKSLEGLSAKGKTPLTAAVSQAAEKLGYTEDRATVVLISDGMETCDRDPCAVAKALSKKGVDFTAHVIGFDISKEQEVAQLKCVAENTGGKFLTAKDASSLKKSLAEVVGEVAKVETGVTLVAVVEPGGEALDSVTWSVRQGDSKKNYGGGSSPRYKLAPGTYIAEARSKKGQAVAEQEFEVVEGETRKVEVVFPVEGNLKLVAVNEKGGEPLDGVNWELLEKTTEEGQRPARLKLGGGAQPEYTMMPGQYLALVKSNKGDARAEALVEVKAGKLNRVEVVLAKEALLELIAVNELGGEALEDVSWGLYTIETDVTKKAKQIKYGGGAKPKYQVLPGKYLAKVKSRRGKAASEQEVEVKVGEENRFEVVLSKEGILALVAVNEPGGEPLQGVRWQVYTIESDPAQKPKQVIYGQGDTPKYRLLPGRYLAKLRSTAGKAKSEQEVEVLAGKENRIEVVMAKEGLLKLVAVSEPGGEPREGMRWSIYTIETDPTKKPTQVTYGKGATPEYKLLPGRYLAKVSSNRGKAKAEQEVEVIGGQRITTEVVIASEAVVRLKAVTVPGGEPLQKIRWSIYSIESDPLKKPEQVTFGRGATPEYILLPGKYLAKGKSIGGMAEVDQEIELKTGVLNDIEILFPAEGLLKLVVVEKEGGDPISRAYWEVLSVETDPLRTPKRIRSGGGASPEYQMLPGKYLARVKPQGASESAELEVEVLPGKRVEAKLVLTEE